MSGRLKDCASTGEVLLLKPPLSSKAGLLTFELMGNVWNGGMSTPGKCFRRYAKSLIE